MAVVTISRAYGSGGDEIAALVCDLLDYYLFDRSLMSRLATEVGLSAGEVVDLSEDNLPAPSLLDRLLARSAPVAEVRTWREDADGVRTPDVLKLDGDQAVATVRTIILAAHKWDKVVIVGRGGQAILRDKPGTVHIRIEAPREDRIQWVQAHKGLPSEEAKSLVAEKDRSSTSYLQRFYNVDASDPQHYHLVINTARVDQETAARLVVAAVRHLEARSDGQAAGQKDRAPAAA